MPPPIVLPAPVSAPEPLWRRILLAYLLPIVGCAGAATWALTAGWAGGIATRGYVDTQVAAANAQADSAMHVAQAALATAGKLQAAIGTPSEVEARQSLADRTRELELEKLRSLHRDTALQRERVGIRVANHVGIDPRRKAAAERADRAARVKFDDLVLRFPPEVAAERVLESAGVPR